jgi:hypothetical protein
MHNDENRWQFVNKIVETIKPSEIMDKSLMKRIQVTESTSMDRRLEFRAIRVGQIIKIAKQIELPIIKGRTASHRNTIDCLLELTVECQSLFKREEESWERAKPLPYEEFKILILCEYKPVLDEISSILGQIHLYIKRVNDMYHSYRNKPTIIPVLITLDSMHDFDYLFSDEDIRIFRLSWDANTNSVVNLPEPPPPVHPDTIQPQMPKLTATSSNVPSGTEISEAQKEYDEDGCLPQGYQSCDQCSQVLPDDDFHFSWGIDGMPICVDCTDGIVYPGKSLVEIQDPNF